MLAQRGRLTLNMEVERWLALVAALQAVRLLSLDPLVAVLATRLPEPFHADPADRFLVSQVAILGFPCSAQTAKSSLIPMCGACGEASHGSARRRPLRSRGRAVKKSRSMDTLMAPHQTGNDVRSERLRR